MQTLIDGIQFLLLIWLLFAMSKNATVYNTWARKVHKRLMDLEGPSARERIRRG